MQNEKRLGELVVCVGAQKAATSSLHSLLMKHPQVAVPKIKETGFFFRDDMYAMGVDWYLSEFFQSASAQILFEADPNYMCFPICLDRLKKCGQVKRIIVMLRDPVARMISSYMMMQRYELEKLSFEEAIRVESKRILQGPMERETFNYGERSTYAPQIRNVLDRFSRENVLFIKFEDFVKDQQKEFEKVQTWLGLEIKHIPTQKENESFSVKSRLVNRLIRSQEFKWFRSLAFKMFGKAVTESIKNYITRLNRNAKAQRRPYISVKMRSELNTMFYDDIKETEYLTGLDLSDWCKS